MSFHKGRILFPLVPIVVVVIAVWIYAQVTFFSQEFSNRIFSEINEFKAAERGLFEPATDVFLSDLPYVDCFSGKTMFEGKTYSVFAYVFPDVVTAQQYFRNVWDEEPPIWEFSGSRSRADLLSCQYMVYSGEKVMYITGNASHMACVGFERWLTESFGTVVQNGADLMMDRLEADPAYEEEIIGATEERIQSGN